MRPDCRLHERPFGRSRHDDPPPPAWGLEKLDRAIHQIGSRAPNEYWHKDASIRGVPQIRRIGIADLKDALRQGVADFGACRTNVIFLCVIYPLLGLLMARMAFGYQMLPLLFPLASGFALVGPFAAVGLYEMSRRREEEDDTTWVHAFGVLTSPAIGRIAMLGTMLIVMFLLWMGAAQTIYSATLGPEPPVSAMQFMHDVVWTTAGWWMIGIGTGVGFLFAVFALAISVVSFPNTAGSRRLAGGGDPHVHRHGYNQSGADGGVGIDPSRRGWCWVRCRRWSVWWS